MSNNEVNYHDIIYSKIISIITADLTIGKTDNDLEPFTDDEINKFIEDNADNIETAITTMIRDYEEDDDCKLLREPELDWIREYLYEKVDL